MEFYKDLQKLLLALPKRPEVIGNRKIFALGRTFPSAATSSD